MTDGYFDFEDERNILKQGHRFTSTGFLNELKTDNWKEEAEAGDWGLVPVSISPDASWVICGLRSKKDDVLQNQKLKHFWSKWLRESGAVTTAIILDASATKITEQLSVNLK